MRFARVLAGSTMLAALLLLSSNGSLISQEKKSAPRGTRQLPANWAKLGLTAAQKEEVYKLQAEYRAKTDKLKLEIEKLNAELAEKRAAVLNDDQRKKLAEIVGASPREKGKTKEKAKD